MKRCSRSSPTAARSGMRTSLTLACPAASPADWTVEEKYSLERDDLFVRQANAFTDQLDGTASAACTLAEGMQTLRVNLAALKSADSGIWTQPATRQTNHQFPNSSTCPGKVALITGGTGHLRLIRSEPLKAKRYRCCRKPHDLGSGCRRRTSLR